MMATPLRPARIAGRTLTNYNHICAFFRSREERNKIVMPFFKEGYDQGEKIFQIVESGRREEHIADCQTWGIDTEQALESGKLEVSTWQESYLLDGYFDGQRMLAMVQRVLDENAKIHPRSRMMGTMEWALEGAPGIEGLVEYEARVNYVLPKYPDPVICAYDVNRHSGRVIMDVLRTHPMVIIGGVLQENPLFVPPDRFLAELAARKQRKLAG